MTTIQDVTPVAQTLNRDTDILVGARRLNPGASPAQFGDLNIPASLLEQGTPYDLPFRFDGNPASAPLTIQRLVLGRKVLIPADFAGSYGWVTTNPAADVTIDMQLQTAGSPALETFGTISISAAGVFSFSYGASPPAALEIPAGSRINFVYQGAAGSPAADPSIIDIDGIIGARIVG